MKLNAINKQNKWDNRRQYARVRTQLAMQYRLIQETGIPSAWNSSNTKNISASGICFESFHPLSLNSLLEVNLNVPFFEAPVNFKAKIVRAQEIKPGEIYGVAASIIDINQTDRKKIQMQLEQIDISGLLHEAVKKGASDIHLTLDRPPILRKSGKLITMNYDILNKESLQRMIFSVLSEEQKKEFSENQELNTAITIVTVAGSYRFRLNVHSQRSIIEAVFHLISLPIKSLEKLGLPEGVFYLAQKKSGLILISGTASSGKSQTCASIINQINKTQACLIFTFEKVIEYIYPKGKALIKSRQIGMDTASYQSALKQVLAQDADVILIGDELDPDSLELALDAALADKLVIICLTSNGVINTIRKVMSGIPQSKKDYFKKALAQVLQGVIFQKRLYPEDVNAKSFIATEILINSPQIAQEIYEENFEQILNLMRNDPAGIMHTLDESLAKISQSMKI